MTLGNIQAHCDRANALFGHRRFAEAEAVYCKILPAGDKIPEIFKNLADCIMRQERLVESVPIYQKALAKRPDYLRAHINLGHVLARLSRHSEAATHYRKALEVAPTMDELKPALARSLAADQQFEAASLLYAEALNIYPARTELHAEAGLLLVKLGDIRGAEAQFQAAIALDARLPALYFELARVRRFVDDDDPFLKSILGLLPDPCWSRAEKVDLLFAAGTALDQIGQHDRAFAQFDEANRLKREGLGYDEVAEIRHLSSMPRLCNPAFLRSAASQHRSPAAPIFIVGMPRSGSTLVEQILAGHSEVHALGEVQYFSEALNLANLSSGPAGAQHFDVAKVEIVERIYRSSVHAMAGPVASPRITDKMLSNFKYVGLIHAALPQAKIIHTRRNPIDTCLSCFFTNFADGQTFSYDLAELGRYYSAYQDLMDYWTSVLPPGSMLDINYEDVVADTDEMARKILGFCDLPWQEQCLRFFDNRRPVLTASGAQVRRPIYGSSVGRSAGYQRFLGPLREALNGTAIDPSLLR